MARATLSTTLDVLGKPVGVELFKAAGEQDFSFSLFDAETLAPVGNKRVRKTDGGEVKAVVRGVVVEKGRAPVVFSDEEIAALKAKRGLRVLKARPATDLRAVLPRVASLYWVKAASETRVFFDYLAAALSASEMELLVAAAVGNRERNALLRVLDGRVALLVLYFPAELKSEGEAEAVRVPDGATDEELKALSAALASLDGREVPDEKERVFSELLAAKLEGKTTSVIPVAKKQAGASVADWLAVAARNAKKVTQKEGV